MMNETKAKTATLNQQQSDEIEIDLVELFYYYLSKIGYIIAGLVVGVVAAWLVAYFFITPMYTGTAKLYMVSSSKGSVVDVSDLNIGNSISQDYVQLIKTRPVIEAVIEHLNLDYTFEEMVNMVNISTVSNTRILIVEFTSPDPYEAMQVANEIVNEAINRLPIVMETPEPHIAEEAIIPEKHSSPSYKKNMLICGLVGMLLVVGVLTLMFILDDTLDSADDVEKAFGIAPLTVIPESDIGTLNEELEHKNKKGIWGRLLSPKRISRKESGS